MVPPSIDAGTETPRVVTVQEKDEIRGMDRISGIQRHREMTGSTPHAAAMEVDAILANRVTHAEMDDRIDAWHNGAYVDGIELHQALGMSWEDYSTWVMDATKLPANLPPIPPRPTTQA